MCLQNNYNLYCREEKESKLSLNCPALLIFENFKAQCTSDLLQILD